jgi:hypothetical protein
MNEATEMVERVARALAKRQVRPYRPWEELPAEWTAGFREDAREVIAALREPTPEIVSAMIAADRRRKRFAQTVKRDWRAGIDAALTTPSTTPA